MLAILGFLFSGIVLGILLRKQRSFVDLTNRLTTYCIYGFLGLLGITVGVNDTVMSNLAQLGYQALLLALGSILGSIALGCLVQRLFFRDFG